MSADGPGFFRSRWVQQPTDLAELDPTALAPGFRAAGAACGLKASGGTDVGIVACDSAEVSSALLLTRNAAAAAPIRVCRDRCEATDLRAAVVNSGNANAATGDQGYADAVAMQERCAAALDLEPAQVAVAETGTIGVPLDTARVLAGIDRTAAELRVAGGEDFSAAIMTTDAGPKRCCVSAGGVTLSAQAKGAGMIEPGFATMLCFVQTDAIVADPAAALRAAVDDSFERITVDGQMSTNDTVLLQASGVERQGACRRACWTRCCCSSRSRSSPTERAPHGSAGSRSAGRRTRPRRRPRPVPSPTPRWSRPPSMGATRTGGESPRRPVRHSPAKSSQSSGPITSMPPRSARSSPRQSSRSTCGGEPGERTSSSAT